MTGEAFLEVFFGAGNRLTRSSFATHASLGDVVARFDTAFERPGVLPRLAADSDRVTWYVLAFDDEDLRRVEEEVLGFLGPTYARWEPANDPGHDDAIEAAVAEVTGGRFLRFFTEGKAENDAVLGPIRRLQQAWSARPNRRGELRRTVRTILRDIDLSLAAGDADGARAGLADLRARGAISVENVRFIEVLALAAQSRWRDIVRHADFEDICRVRHPWRVTEALITALYMTRAGASEAAGDVPAALAAYARTADTFELLLRARGPLRAPAVIKAAALRIAANPKRLAAMPLALDELDEGDRRWANALLGRSAVEEPTPPGPRAAFEAGAFDVALEEALATEPPAALADLVMLAAYELGTLEAATSAVRRWREFSDDERAAASGRRLVRDAVAALESLVGDDDAPEPPASWLDWFRRLVDDPDWSAALAVAWCGAVEFDRGGVADEATLDEIITLIARAAEGPAAATLLEGLPGFMTWLARSEPRAASARRLYGATLEALALMDGWDTAGLEVAAELVERLLETGTSRAEYADMLDSIDVLWNNMSSPRHAAWFADLMEMLEVSPGDRDRLLSTVMAGVVPLRAEVLAADVREGLRLSAHALGANLDLPEPRVESVDDEPLTIVDGSVIGVYTLTPQVGARVRDRLQQMFPTITVTPCGDKVATERLVHLARTADLLVVAIGSAKHAATDAIDANRPADRPTLRHAFRGSTRIVAACQQAIRDGALSQTPSALGT